jgi:adenylylsulfate kinase
VEIAMRLPEFTSSDELRASVHVRPSGVALWLTGLPCAGKSTLARALANRLRDRGRPVEILDGDVVRQHLSQGLGYSREDRDINVLRIGYVAELLVRNGVIAIVAMVSPYTSARDEVRRRIGRFFEVHVSCPLGECERRDVKGMYGRARAGQIHHFTGVDDPYEPPPAPEAIVDTSRMTISDSVDSILSSLERYSGY